MAVAMPTADADTAGAMPMDMHSGYEAYGTAQLDGVAEYQQAQGGGEHPAQRLQRLQAEAAQLAAQQAQVGLHDWLFVSSCHLTVC
jgi:hypothetical protein